VNATARIRSFPRIAALLALAALGTASAQVAAGASPQLCRQLEAQLASVERPAGGQARRYDKAIRAQELELEKTRSRASNSGCDGFFGGLRGQCGPLKSAITRMENNLAALRQQRGGIAGDPRRERARLQDQLDANGCRSAPREASLKQAPKERKPALFEQLFGGKITHRQRLEDAPEIAGTGLRGATAAAGNYRTLCVRTCDGYFFPIAYSSSPANFDQDAKACEAACPGTDVELFRHRVPDEEAEQAVSTRTGQPYGQLPNAFLYRKAGYSRPATCGCNAPKGFSVVAGGNYEPKEPAAAEAADLAAARSEAPPEAQVAAKDPRAAAVATSAETASGETAAIEAPDLFAAAPASEDATASVEDKKPAERRVRVVGPAFLPDPSGAIDLRAPGRKEVR
jgi:hypothetical protein